MRGGGIGQPGGVGPFTFPWTTTKQQLQDMNSSIKSTWNLKHLFMIIQILFVIVSIGWFQNLTWEIVVSLNNHLHTYIYKYIYIHIREKTMCQKWSQ